MQVKGNKKKYFISTDFLGEFCVVISGQIDPLNS